MTLFDTSQFQTCLSLDFLVKTYPWLETEQDSLEVAQVCFLRDSDFFKPSSLVPLSLRTWRVCSQLTGEPISNPYSNALMNWGMWGHGRCVTGIVGCRKIEPERLSLQDCLIDSKALYINEPVRHRKGAGSERRFRKVSDFSRAITSSFIENYLVILDKHPSGDRIYSEYSPTLRSTTNGGGHPFRIIEGEAVRPLQGIEAERLMGWPENSTEKGITQEGEVITISKTQRMKALGNGVIPQEIEHLANSLKEILCR